MILQYIVLLFSIFISMCYNFNNSNNELRTQITLKRNNNEELITLLNDFLYILEDQKSFYNIHNETINDDVYKIREDQINTISQESKENILYDVENRVSLQNIYLENGNIENYNLLNFRTISKHDTGVFTNLLTVYSLGNTVKILDIFGNLLFEKTFGFDINHISIFTSVDESYIFLLTDKHTMLRKYRFEYIRVDRNKGNKNMINQDKNYKSLIKTSIENQKITVKTYKDEDINTYEVTSTYYKNIKRLKFDLVEMASIGFEKKRILKISNNINRGERMILVQLENIFHILNDDLNPSKNFTFQMLNESTNKSIANYDNIIYSIFQSFIGYISDRKLVITSLETFKTILLCDFPEKINNFVLDSINNYLYILLDNGVLHVVQPKVSSQNNELNTCENINILKLKYIEPNNHFKIDIIRKDLIIDSSKFFIFIDTSKTEEITMDSVKYVDKKYDSFFSDLMVANRSETEENFVYQKTVQGNYVLYKSSLFNNVVILLNIFNPNSKLSSNNDFGFNVKVPIIFLSIIIIAIYQYNKKKNEEGSINPEHDRMKEEMLEQIRKLSKGGKLKPKNTKGFASSGKVKKESESEEEEEEDD